MKCQAFFSLKNTNNKCKLRHLQQIFAWHFKINVYKGDTRANSELTIQSLIQYILTLTNDEMS